MSRARSYFVVNYPRPKRTFFYVRLMDNADEQVAKEMDLLPFVHDYRGMRIIYCDSHEEAVELCVKINDKSNAFRLPPGTDPLSLQKEHHNRR